jgi:predicted CXXCH cytochrome family protein
MDKFICVRVDMGNGMDLNLFQFDYEQTWAVFLLNGDGVMYGRYGTRSASVSRTNGVAGLRKALEGALELHKAYPSNAKALLPKLGQPGTWKTPEANPQLKPFPGMMCIHCHQVHEAEVRSLLKSKQPIPDRLVWPYPLPSYLGLEFDGDEAARLKGVLGGSPAEKAGFREGDRVLRMQGQPMISIADVQWVIHWAKEGSPIKVDVERGREKVELTLIVPLGWRRADDFTWRGYFVLNLRGRLLGTGRLEPLTGEDRKNLGLAPDGLALRVKELAPDTVEDRNRSGLQTLRAGDVIVEADARKSLKTEADLLAYLMQSKASGQKVDLVIQRDGKPLRLAIVLP